MQLGTFTDETERRGIAKFQWGQGLYPAEPPPGFETYFGARPLFRFIQYDGTSAFDMLDKIRDFPEGSGAEEVMRLLMEGNAPAVTASIHAAFDDLIKTIDADAEIEVCCLPPAPGLPSPPAYPSIPARRPGAYSRDRRPWPPPHRASWATRRGPPWPPA